MTQGFFEHSKQVGTVVKGVPVLLTRRFALGHLYDNGLFGERQRIDVSKTHNCLTI